MTTGLDVQTSTNDMFAYQDLADAGIDRLVISPGPGTPADAGNSADFLQRFEGFVQRGDLA